MAYSDENRAIEKAATKKRQDAKRIYTYKIFARLYVSLGQNGMEATRKTFPTIKNEKAILHEKNKLMKNPYVQKQIEIAKSEALTTIELTTGKIAQEYWYQYNKYKDEPKKWQAALASLTGLGKLMPKEPASDDQSNLPGNNITIYMPQPLEVGAAMRQPDYKQIPVDLLDVANDKDVEDSMSEQDKQHYKDEEHVDNND